MKQGRPKKPENDQMVRKSLWVRPADWKRWERFAKKHGLGTVSAYIRWCCNNKGATQ